MGNLHTENHVSRRNFDWLFRWMSINQKSGRQMFHRRVVSGSIFRLALPPECFTEQNKNRAWLQVSFYQQSCPLHIETHVSPALQVSRQNILFRIAIARSFSLSRRVGLGQIQEKITILRIKWIQVFKLGLSLPYNRNFAMRSLHGCLKTLLQV